MKIYVKLLDEGVRVFRPVPAIKLGNQIYKVGGFELYNSEDEVWEFPPDTNVFCEEQILSGEKVLVAIREQDSI